MSFNAQKVFHFDEVQFVCFFFFFITCAFAVLSKKISVKSSVMKPGVSVSLCHLDLASHSSFYLSSAAAAKSLQSCPTLCDHMDGSLPGSSVHGIFQARVLEWGAIAFSTICLLVKHKYLTFPHPALVININV